MEEICHALIKRMMIKKNQKGGRGRNTSRKLLPPLK
jgi:hypothetical protein